jgi:sugar diacid utilization regulator
VLGGTLTVLDEDGRCLVQVGDGPVDASPQLDDAIRRSLGTGRVSSWTGTDASWSVAAVTVDRQHFGSLVLRRTDELDEADQRILERAALVTALLRLAQRSGIEAENRVRGELLDDLLRDATHDGEALLDRGRRLGTDLTRPHSVYAVGLDGADRRRAAGAFDHLVARRSGLAGTFDGHPVLVLPDDDPAQGARTLADELSSVLGQPVTVGGSGPVVGVEALAIAHQEAARCMTALTSLGRRGEGASLAELGFVGLVLGDQPDVEGFVRQHLGPILEYDARRGTDLLDTLQAYFDAGWNLARTRELLHVHVNTVTQRLDRIGKLIGEDWQEPARRLELHVALRLFRVSHPDRRKPSRG